MADASSLSENKTLVFAPEQSPPGAICVENGNRSGFRSRGCPPRMRLKSVVFKRNDGSAAFPSTAPGVRPDRWACAPSRA